MRRFSSAPKFRSTRLTRGIESSLVIFVRFHKRFVGLLRKIIVEVILNNVMPKDGRRNVNSAGPKSVQGLLRNPSLASDIGLTSSQATVNTILNMGRKSDFNSCVCPGPRPTSHDFSRAHSSVVHPIASKKLTPVVVSTSS